MADNSDNRRFSSTLEKPTRVRFRHDGTVYYDQVHEGETELFLRDLGVPFAGVTEVLIGDSDKAFCSFRCT